MKKYAVYCLSVFIVLAALFVTPACNKSTSGSDDLVGNWLLSYAFDGNARSEAATFTIGNQVYVATGLSDRDRFSDLFQYDLDRKYWLQLASLPATAPARNSAIAFAINGNGYLGTGFDGVNKLNDMWQFVPGDNKWYPRNNFGGSARYDAVSFVLGDKAYVATGYDGNYLKDLWQYDPGSDSWTQKASLGGNKRSAAVAFVLNNHAYVCSGSNNGTAQNDLWVYDPATDDWEEKRKLTNVSDESYDDTYAIPRLNGVAFVMGNKAYVTAGENGSLLTDTWEYDYTQDLWTKKTPIPTGRSGAVAFTLKDRGFVMTGRSGTLPFDNMYEFQPNAVNNDDDNN